MQYWNFATDWEKIDLSIQQEMMDKGSLEHLSMRNNKQKMPQAMAAAYKNIVCRFVLPTNALDFHAEYIYFTSKIFLNFFPKRFG